MTADAREPPLGRFDDDWPEPIKLPDRSGRVPAKPTREKPLAGLVSLASVALLGREAILDLAAQAIDYVWQDIAPPGTITMIAGPPADGKTTLLFLIICARATLGDPIELLCRQVRPAPVEQFIVVIEGEHSEKSTARKLVKSLVVLGVDDAALERVIIVARKAVTLGSAPWADVVRLVEAGLVSDIAIDTVARVAPAGADSEAEQVAIFEGVTAAIEAAPHSVDKPSVWAVAHTRKNNTSGELTDVSGSAQRVGQSDSVLLVKAERADGRVVSSKVTFAKLREDPDEYPAPVEFTIGKGADGQPKITTNGAAAASKLPLEDQIITHLASGPQSKTALTKLTNRSKNDVDAAITVLFQRRAIQTGPEKVFRGGRCKTFELTSTAESGQSDWMSEDPSRWDASRDEGV